MATTGRASARAIKPDGLALLQSFSSRAVSDASRKSFAKKGSKNSSLQKHKPIIAFDRGICNDYDAASSREWLVTNAIGGFAAGTISGCSTRRYHGQLFAALQPPVGRTQLVAAIDEIISYAGRSYELATHEWAGGAIAPRGFLFIEKFRREGTIPTWTYVLGDARLEKRIWMRQGENTTYVRYTLLEATSPVEFQAKALVNYRDFHSSTHAGDWRMQINPAKHGVCVRAFDGATPFYLQSAEAMVVPQHIWYRNCFFKVERDRGLDDDEDHLFAAEFRATLEPGKSLTIVFSLDEATLLDGNSAIAEQIAHESSVVQTTLEAFANND